MTASIWKPNGFSPEIAPLNFFEFTASPGQTTFSISPFTSLSDAQLKVWVAGELRSIGTWSNTGTDIVLSAPLSGGEFVRVDVYAAIPSDDAELPSQVGNAGKILSTDGTNPSWINIPEELPDHAGNAGKALLSDGSTAYWGNLVIPPTLIDNVLNYIPSAEHAAILAGTSTYDVHADVQTAINAVANSWKRKLFFPAGRYNIPPTKKLRTYYDATNNPGYPRIRNAHIELIGEGKDSEASGTGVPGNLCGTLFWSDPATVRTVPFLEVSPASEDALPYFGRDFVARDISFDGNSTGHLVVCRGVPGATLHNVQIRQRNAAGSGLEWGTTYIGGLYGCRIANSAGGATTGDGITLSASIEAGLYEIDAATIVGGFGYGLRQTSGTVQQLNIKSTQLTGSIGGIHILGGGTASVEVLNISGGYGEGTCQYWIKGGSEAIRVLRITGGFVFGAGFTQAAIQLDKPDAVSIDGIRVQDLAGTFMNVASLPSLSHNPMYVRGAHFYYTGAIATLRTLFTGVLPALEMIEWPEGNPNCRLCALTSTPIRMAPLFATDSSMITAGHLRQSHDITQSPAVNGTTYFHGAQGYPAIAYFAAHTANINYELNNGTTAKLGNNFVLEIVNRGTGTITVTRAILGTTIVTVAAGTKTRLIWSDTFNDWV